MLYFISSLVSIDILVMDQFFFTDSSDEEEEGMDDIDADELKEE